MLMCCNVPEVAGSGSNRAMAEAEAENESSCSNSGTSRNAKDRHASNMSHLIRRGCLNVPNDGILREYHSSQLLNHKILSYNTIHYQEEISPCSVPISQWISPSLSNDEIEVSIQCRVA
ncbi:unnamed protein product [Fusarium graminearum]|uniref:Chromosome 1, complete genome n=1 Tax=Gibberella zeae (strain ATCC MYA-4620 / CBS 123657 / FGSC 9075 / NRRL 31084 / PH-1) TaxID=229533 RepID=I1S4K8_GIBZE|nr:hypothetical protein FGSG_11776 [Fusarium graminearum PH-1]ESU05719.1 hypothetical protein FGSG_11776 [Fusarium graminearum PH-1]CEF72474.1 unnamed protein product [Fusarium graminearum]CZS75737.1 unnamed protein product [Fusarium graminearum]|eukprot:XP_011316204.1 hypothetical protein FGSG_11776 [Fusarium graminearum PH-1]